MLLKPLYLIPFWRAFVYYKWPQHKSAIQKFAILWLISIAPLVASALFSPIGVDTNIFQKVSHFFERLLDEFQGTHQFIYAVSFISPVLYLFYERFAEFDLFYQSGLRKAKGRLQEIPSGFKCIVLWSALIFCFTVLCYSADATVESRGNFIIDSVSGSTVILVYVFSLFCWYFSVLESTRMPDFDFQKSKKMEESSFLENFTHQVSGGGD